jgi:tetratricopeptide (TPR) repeat protein
MRKTSLGDLLNRKFAARALLLAVLSIGSVWAEASPKAEELYRQTEYRQSLALLDSKSSDPATNNLIGRNHYMSGDFKKAAEYFQKAYDGDPGNSMYALWLGRAWGRRAETSNPFLAPGYASKARQWMEKAIALDPRNTEALSDVFDYYLDAPGFLGGGYDKAQEIARRMSDIEPAEGYFARARLAEKRNEYDTAEAQLRRAMDAAPKQVSRVVELAKFLAKQGRAQESDALFAKAEKMEPNTPGVWYARADTLIKQKRNLDEAKRLLQKYVQSSAITPDDPSKSDAEKLLKQVSGGA